MLNLLTVNKLLAHRPWEVTPEHMKVREWGEGEGGGERREGGSKGRGGERGGKVRRGCPLVNSLSVSLLLPEFQGLYLWVVQGLFLVKPQEGREGGREGGRGPKLHTVSRNSCCLGVTRE